MKTSMRKCLVGKSPVRLARNHLQESPQTDAPANTCGIPEFDVISVIHNGQRSSPSERAIIAVLRIHFQVLLYISIAKGNLLKIKLINYATLVRTREPTFHTLVFIKIPPRLTFLSSFDFSSSFILFPSLLRL